MRAFSCVLTAVLAVASLSADEPAGQRLRLRCGARCQDFQVVSPHAAISAAARLNEHLAQKDGTVPPPTGGFLVASRVIVQACDGRHVDALCAAYGLTGRRAPGDSRVIETASVEAAAELAERLALDPRVAYAAVDIQSPYVLRSLPTDPNFGLQWHLHNTLDPLFDVNAEPAWAAGWTGSGVTIGIVENGWQYDHPDLAGNFSADATQIASSATWHATAVAGVAAAVANNGLMGAGMAHGAMISNQLIGTDSEIADAIAFRNDLNDIKNNSWGPLDDATARSLSPLVRAALEEAISTGRGGLGTVFVWAAGNGGSSNDRVEYDPYASSRYTIAIGAIGDAETRPFYSEVGASLLGVAHSDGNGRDIYTTANNGGDTHEFGGTSSAAPLASGAVALLLEARPDLTWRDVQHVLIRSARKNDPASSSWVVNGAGRDVSYNYGFGAVDAAAALDEALGWPGAAHELSFDSEVVEVGVAVPDNDTTGVTQTLEIAEDLRLEAVELIFDATSTYIGDLRIEITAPSGTRSLVAVQRLDAQDEYDGYVFTSLRHWDERSAGLWSVNVSDRAVSDVATWNSFQLRLYGTLPCYPDYNSDGLIELSDLGAVLSAWGACEGDEQFDPKLDENNDGCVGLSELESVLAAWGESCP